MTWIIVGAIALVAVLGLLRVFVDAKPGDVKTALIWGGGIIGAVLVAVLVWAGRDSQAIWSLLLVAPAAMRALRGFRAARTFSRGGAASPGQASDVETSHIAMGLDHDSGRMFGRVKAGRFEGADLAELDLPRLLDLMAELAARDPEGVPLLEAWLDRAHPDWREATPPGPPPAGPMTRAEALEVLGLAAGASAEDIRAAHRRLMRAAHPDRGGSDWLAARLNEARDVLLGD